MHDTARRPSDTSYPIRRYGSIRHIFYVCMGMRIDVRYDTIGHSPCPIPAVFSLKKIKNWRGYNSLERIFLMCISLAGHVSRMSDTIRITGRDDICIGIPRRDKSPCRASSYWKRTRNDTRIVQLYPFKNTRWSPRSSMSAHTRCSSDVSPAFA